MTPAGLYVPLITPFDEHGEVAHGALRRLARDVLDDGAAGLVALGTTGEPSALSRAERAAVLDTVTAAAAGRPVLAGANDAGALRALAGRAGVSAALTLVPPFVRAGAEGVIAHLRELAALSPVPLVIYHVPYRTAQVLPVAALRRIAAIPGVIGMKLAAGGVDADTVALLADPPPGFAVLAGDDVVVSPLLAIGAAGGVLASAHVATASFAALIAAWAAGDATRGRRLGHRLSPLSAALFAEPNPTVVKAVLHAQGRIPTPAVRLPLLSAGDAALAAALAHS